MRMPGCFECSQLTSGDCGKHGPYTWGSPTAAMSPAPLLGLPSPPMSLRDYFAGQALAVLFADPAYQHDHTGAAEDAYAWADAMLKAREQA